MWGLNASRVLILAFGRPVQKHHFSFTPPPLMSLSITVCVDILKTSWLLQSFSHSKTLWPCSSTFTNTLLHCEQAGAELGQVQLKMELGFTSFKICCNQLIDKKNLCTQTANNNYPSLSMSSKIQHNLPAPATMAIPYM